MYPPLVYRHALPLLGGTPLKINSQNNDNIVCPLSAAAHFRDVRHSLVLYWQGYNGVNLIVGDLKVNKVAYLTNRDRSGKGAQPRELPPGVYGISNGVLGDRWNKVTPAFFLGFSFP